MKTVILAAVLALSAIPAFAGNSSRAYVMAEVIHHPGFVPPSMRFVSGVRVLSDGSVIHFAGGKDTFKSRLAAREVSRLKAEIERIRETELVDRDAGKPRCMDGPSVVYSVKTAAASPELEIASFAGCHRFELKRGDGRSIKLFLDRLEQ